jgi:CheY-like chemotaxis protein
VGYTVIEAEDGIAALDVIRSREHQIDLIVLDLTMPRMGGAEVMAILRAERRGLPVVVASGYDRADRRADLSRDENVRFLQKPFDRAALVAAVTGLLDRRDVPVA